MSDYAVFTAPPGLRQHPLSAAFPQMEDKEFQSLKDSIMNLGVTNPITVFEDMVLDGWHRYRAALETDSACPARVLEEGTDPRAFVMAQNKERRHVTVAQLALIAVQVWQWMPRGRPAQGEAQNSALSADLTAKSTHEISKSTGLGTRSIEQAKLVKAHAVPEVLKTVEIGGIGLPKAAAIARLPKDEQAQALQKPLPKKPARAAQSAPPAPQMTPAGEDISDISRADAMADAEQLLLDLQREIEEYQARIAALTADDAKAQLDQALRLQQQAERARDDALDNAAQWQSRVNFLQHEFDRVAQILGLARRAPIRAVVQAIEALARQTGAINMRNAA